MLYLFFFVLFVGEMRVEYLRGGNVTFNVQVAIRESPIRGRAEIRPHVSSYITPLHAHPQYLGLNFPFKHECRLHVSNRGQDL